MKRLFLIVSILLPGFIAAVQGAEPPVSAATPLTLDECFQMALTQSESLAMIREQVLQFEARARQARSAILPDVNFLYTHFFQDSSASDSSGGGVGGTLTRNERPEAKITGRQPLFGGFREFSAWYGFKSLQRREELELLNAKKALYREVALAFYSVVQLETDLANNQTILTLTTDRVKELESRSRLGKSRPSEVLSVQSQVATLTAQDEKIKGDLWVARDLLSFLTGKNLQETPLSDTLPPVAAPADEASVLAFAGSVTEMAIIKATMDSDKYQVRYARGRFLPSVDISGNYYLKRVGFQENIKWDALLTVDMPIFQGGENLALLRQAQSQARWTEWSYRRLKREVESQIRRNFYTLKSSIAQVKALENAYAKSKESYESQVKEYRYGLVNNLEVIQALNTMQVSKRDLDRTDILNRLNYIQLQISTEQLPKMN